MPGSSTGQSSSSKENYLDTLRAIDPQLVKTAVSGPRFQQCFFENCGDKAIEDFVRQIVA